MKIIDLIKLRAAHKVMWDTMRLCGDTSVDKCSNPQIKSEALKAIDKSVTLERQMILKYGCADDDILKILREFKGYHIIFSIATKVGLGEYL